MIDAICAHLHNYFTEEEDIHRGTWVIENGEIDLSDILLNGQYFRIVGSALNDGVYQYPVTAAGGEESLISGEQSEPEPASAAEQDAGETRDPQSVARARGVLSDETFDGEIWAMKVPRAVIALAGEITAWQAQYGAAMASPYQSESVIGVYSYNKATSGSGAGGSADAWKDVFRGQLNQWRKLR